MKQHICFRIIILSVKPPTEILNIQIIQLIFNLGKILNHQNLYTISFELQDREYFLHLTSNSSSKIEDTQKDIIQMMKNYKLNALYETTESTEYLPKTILWDLADYLIKITSLKQKLSSDDETVSSETEIAFITKTSNFNWIKKENVTFKYK